MTSPPVPGFEPATLLQPPSYWWIQISGTAQGIEISQALEAAVAVGIIANGTSVVNMKNDVLGWQISVIELDNIQEFCGQGDYIVLITNSSGTITGIQLYNGPAGIFNDPLFSGMFTANVPLVWAATTTAPVAAPQPGGAATIVFQQPTSPNAPWNYTVTQTVGGTTSAATVVGEPVIDDNGVVTLTISGLTAGSQYTFVVTVNTQYPGVSVTALPTNQITAVA
jgi:hypothetical protein